MRPTLEDVQQHFNHWRSNKKTVREPISKELWDLAVELTQTHSQKKVAQSLGLNSSSLSEQRSGRLGKRPKKRQKEPTPLPTFIEAALPQKRMQRSVEDICERIEFERADGHRMKVVFRSGWAAPSAQGTNFKIGEGIVIVNFITFSVRIDIHHILYNMCIRCSY